MQKGLISIIIPVYNAGKFIERCLQSLLGQTYSNIEILCVDDCSHDNSCELINEFVKKDNRVKLFQNKENSGPATTRNVGLDNANGEFIMFCDNDDEYKPTMCEVMVNTLIKEDVDLGICRSEIFNLDLDIGAYNYTNKIPLERQILNQDNRVAINVFVWNKIYKKELIDKYAIRFPDGLMGEDTAFIIMYCAVAKSVFGIIEPLYNFILRPNSATNTIGKFNSGNRLFDRIKIIEYVYDFLIENDLFDTQEQYFKEMAKLELDYISGFAKSKNVAWKIKKTYNNFVKRKKLNWKKYNYSAIRCLFSFARVKESIKLFKKCVWI